MRAYTAAPAAARSPLPAVIVIQEIWGPDGHIQDVTHRVAEAGYAALAPDLYSRGGRPPVLAPERVEAVKAFLDTLPPAAWGDRGQLDAALAREREARARELQATLGTLFAPRDPEETALDLLAWAAYLAEAPISQGMPVAVMGFCMGATLAFELATRLERLRAALVFYGSAPATAALGQIHCPVHGFYGREDHRITDALPAVEAAMQAAGRSFTARVYPSAGHAFFNDTRPAYDVAAARDAWARSLGILAQELTTG